MAKLTLSRQIIPAYKPWAVWVGGIEVEEGSLGTSGGTFKGSLEPKQAT